MKKNILILCLFILSFQFKMSYCSNTSIPHPTKNSNYAYASVYYHHATDYTGLKLGLQVLIQSIKDSNTTADIVVIVSPNTSSSEIYKFEEMGCIIKEMNFPDPFSSSYQVNSSVEFQRLLNRLLAWKLTQYKRVIYIEPSTILLRNMDHLFNCGYFCAVDTQPMMHVNDLFVISPGHNQTYQLVKSAILDASDMYRKHNNFGYVPKLWELIEESPLFHPDKQLTQLPLFQRLPTTYNLNHMFYYEKGNWDLYTCNFIVDKTDTITYPGYSITYAYRVVPFSQPWLWFSYGYFFKLNYIWQKTRNSISYDSSGFLFIYRIPLAFMLLLPLIYFRRLIYLNPFVSKFDALYEFIEWIGDNEGLWFLLSLFALIVIYSISFVLVPMMSSPLVGWIFFLTVANSMLYFLCSILSLTRPKLYNEPASNSFITSIVISVIAVIIQMVRVCFFSDESIPFSVVILVTYVLSQIRAIPIAVLGHSGSEQKRRSSYEPLPH